MKDYDLVYRSTRFLPPDTLRWIFIAHFTLIFIACDGQAKQMVNRQSLIINTKQGEKFNIETFNKYQQNGSYEFDQNNTHVLEFSYAAGYAEEITYPDKLFKLTKDFYRNGNLKQKGLAFIKGSFMKGVWQFYAPSGKLSHEIDYDSWYTYAWENVQRFLHENHVELKDIIDISRTWKEHDERVWVIAYKTTPDKNGNYIRSVTLNGDTGKLLKDERVRPQRY